MIARQDGIAGHGDPGPTFEVNDIPVWPAANRIGSTHVEPKTMDVLLCLIAAAPDVVPLQRLIEEVWRNTLVGDGVIHRAISHLRRALRDDPKNPQCIETIPRRGYRLIAKIARHHRPRPAAEPPAAEAPAGEAAHRAMAPGGDRSPVLAVLPFDNISADAELGYFSDGVSEEILHTVAMTAALSVLGRSSSFQFRGVDKAPKHVAEVLGCTHVLDGSVRRYGQRVRVSAQLVECAGQSTLWNETYEHDLTDVFALQDRVAAAVAGALRVAFASAKHLAPIDPIAYDCYLKAKASTSQWLGANYPGLLEQAIARVPTFARAWAELAVSRAIEAHIEQDPVRSEGPRERAIEAAEAALRLDPASAAAYVALSIVEPICGHFRERDSLIGAALEAAPSDTAVLFWAGRWCWTVGRLHDFLGHLERCQVVDPLWPQGVHQYASALWVVGRREEAIAVWDQALARWPDLDYLYSAQLGFASIARDWRRVDDLLRALRDRGPRTSATEMAVRHAEDVRHWRPADRRRFLSRLREKFERTGSVPLRLLIFACDVGLVDEAYAFAERSSFEHLYEPGGRLAPGDFGLHHLFSPAARALRRDPRFPLLCKRLGLCDYWVEADQWPDCADDVAEYYDFRAAAQK